MTETNPQAQRCRDEYQFLLVGTGWEFDQDNFEFLDTLQDTDGYHIWHIFYRNKSATAEEVKPTSYIDSKTIFVSGPYTGKDSLEQNHNCKQAEKVLTVS